MKRGCICLIVLLTASGLAACEPRPPKPKTGLIALADPAYRVRLAETGTAQLSSNAARLSRGEQYEMNVKLFEGGRLVAEQTARRP